ncbi:MAG: 4-hydroxy-3-methylbut-2-enyl diphosphate reductase [Crocinitomix sp.]|nr:4-hydroxy-3-methylbut-2-enyl diphosphate reductase [Crocinitomix sp.]
MKTFNIPTYYRSPIISRVKAIRSKFDKRKKDFTPTRLNFGNVEFILGRHFGFCFGVENAIEISYKAIEENPDKRIFLLSQMIHNPGVNGDLEKHGIQFLQDTKGNQIIPWSEVKADDVVIIPAFGTTLEIESILNKIGVDTPRYDTTCPFVERVWKKSEKLGSDAYTVIIHGKDNHEETRATFSHASASAKSIVIRDIEEAKLLGEMILGERTESDFLQLFVGRYSGNFSYNTDLTKIGVVNQTTMLASETQEISDYLAEIMIQKFGEENSKNHFANTRDTLCYATNDNQSATIALLEEEANLAIVVGGYNSSNTSHLVELCERKFKTFYIKDENEIQADNSVHHFNMHTNQQVESNPFLPENRPLKIVLTSGASCPDATVDRVIQCILEMTNTNADIELALTKFKETLNEEI